MSDTFEYKGTEYSLIGYTDGILPSAKDYKKHFRYLTDTSDGSICYGIKNEMLVIKSVSMYDGQEFEEITHSYRDINGRRESYNNLGNPIIEMTGYILFSDLWDLLHIHLPTLVVGQDEKYMLFEAQIEAGKVLSVSEISESVREITLNPDTENLDGWWRGSTDAERLKNTEKMWNFTAKILSRRYDTLYYRREYINFPERIAELRSQITSK